MSRQLDNTAALVPAGENLSSVTRELPAILTRAGQAAVFAAEEFFFGKIRNEHTRAAYLHAVRRFLAWAEWRQLEMRRSRPRTSDSILTGCVNRI